jgi:DNA (cytosine-5)-methyltransferase 1
MKYFSLFTGVGGFEIGIQNAKKNNKIKKKCSRNELVSMGQKSRQSLPASSDGDGRGLCSECVGFSEIDKYANQVLKYRFPKVKNYGDITKINWSEVPDFDLLVGGSPCQDFSIAGKRKGIKGERSGLIWEYIRCLEEKKPRYFIWENVKGVMSSRRGFDFGSILAAFSEAGYSLWWQVLNAKDFGVPQNRERVFIIGYSGGECPREVFFERNSNETNNGKQQRNYSGTVKKGWGVGTNDGTYLREITKEKSQGYRVYDPQGISTNIASQAGGLGAKTELYMLNLHQKRTEEYGDGIKEMNESSFTLDSSSGRDLTIANNTKIRRLTPTECERLMSWPDNWTKWGINEKGEKVEISDTQRYKMCGNGVVSKVVEEIIKLCIR